MDNYELSKLLNIYAKLYELHGGNPFKLKSLTAAAFNLKKVSDSVLDLNVEEIKNHPQISKTILPKIIELKETQKIEELEELIAKTPKGVMDLLQIKGLGPKKVEVLWKEIGIETILELSEACRENRLVEVKGFGLKTQALILKDIEFKINQEGKLHWAKAELIVNELLPFFKSIDCINQIEISGAFKRLSETVDSLDFVMVCSDVEQLIKSCQNDELILINQNQNSLEFKYLDFLKINCILASKERFYSTLLETSSTSEHLKIIDYQTVSNQEFNSEQEIYAALNLPFVLPELREGLSELHHLNKQAQLIQYTDLKGVIHNHTTYSDGLNTLKEMADYAKDCHFEYLVVCDHSQTASYAGGLKPEKVLQQFAEIQSLNQTYQNFKVFKGIESDILGDGSLDYETDLLNQFDVVVASVHSNLNMDKEKANQRLIKAIEHPKTRILGHPTGRLLLMRPGYSIDYQLILDACFANQVVVELNAHPYRLDLDWRWIDYFVSKGGLISINPDAHQKEGYHDMKYGVNVARKAYLTPEHCLNAKNLMDFEQWVHSK